MAAAVVSRRDALTGAAALGMAGVLSGLGEGTAHAKAPFREAGAPGYYTFTHGKMQLTVVSDGPIPVGDAAGVYPGAAKAELDAMLTANFRQPDRTVLELNGLVVNTGDKLVLIDPGLGANAMFGPTTGRLMKNLAAAGIAPGDIDAVLISHVHPDHVGGLTDAKDAIQFPNAQVYVTEADFAFWTDEQKLGGDSKPFIEAARTALMPYRDRMVFIKDGQDVVPGIQAMAAPGHTVGHTVFLISSDGKTLCNAADTVHHKVVSLHQPRYEFAYDSDKAQGVATRVKLLDMLANDRIPMLAYHFDWPGIGYVSKEGDGFRYHEAQTRLVPIPEKQG